MSVKYAADLHLVREVLALRDGAWERLTRRIADPAWTACLILEGSDAKAREAFIQVMDGVRGDNFHRLSSYNGTSRIETFIVLLTRELLIQRLLGKFAEGRQTAWAAMEHFFAADIRRIIARRLPGDANEEARHDAYQEICLRLVEDDFRRLKAYQGSGSFGGFLLHMVDRLVIDIVRQSIGRGDKEHSPRPVTLDDDQWETLSSPHPSPEQSLLTTEEETLLTGASAALTELADGLPPAEALYLRIALGGAAPLPAREIARLMGRPTTEVYKLKQRLMARLHDVLSEHPAVKKWRETV